jgi:hypothetical protein
MAFISIFTFSSYARATSILVVWLVSDNIYLIVDIENLLSRILISLRDFNQCELNHDWWASKSFGRKDRNIIRAEENRNMRNKEKRKRLQPLCLRCKYRPRFRN